MGPSGPAGDGRRTWGGGLVRKPQGGGAEGVASLPFRGGCAELLTTVYVHGHSGHVRLCGVGRGYTPLPGLREEVARPFSPRVRMNWEPVERALATGSASASPPGTPDERLEWTEVEQRLRRSPALAGLRFPQGTDRSPVRDGGRAWVRHAGREPQCNRRGERGRRSARHRGTTPAAAARPAGPAARPLDTGPRGERLAAARAPDDRPFFPREPADPARPDRVTRHSAMPRHHWVPGVGPSTAVGEHHVCCGLSASRRVGPTRRSLGRPNRDPTAFARRVPWPRRQGTRHRTWPAPVSRIHATRQAGPATVAPASGGTDHADGMAGAQDRMVRPVPSVTAAGAVAAGMDGRNGPCYKRGPCRTRPSGFVHDAWYGPPDGSGATPHEGRYWRRYGRRPWGAARNGRFGHRAGDRRYGCYERWYGQQPWGAPPHGAARNGRYGQGAGDHRRGCYRRCYGRKP